MSPATASVAIFEGESEMSRSTRMLKWALPVAAVMAFGATTAAQAANDVTIAFDANVLGLNPANLNDNLSMSAARTVMQGLFGFDKDMKLIPVLAESYEANDEATEFTIHLRKGVTFSDGTAFNAAAVKTSFDFMRDPANHLKRLSLYSPIDTIETPDENTVKIKLKQPFGPFIANLAHIAFAIMSPKAIAEYGKDLDRHAVGTGPFVLGSWQTDTLKVVKNPTYWQAGWPKVDSITIKSVPEDGTRLSMLRTGEAQFIYPVPTEMAKVLDHDPKFELINKPSIYAYYSAMNTLKKPFDDVRVREALNYAVDKDAMVRVVFNGYAVKLDSPLPAGGLFGYSQVEKGGWPFDPAKAKKLLADAGYPNGFSTTLWGGTSSMSRKAMVFLQQQLAAVGVKVEVEPLESGVLISRIYGVQKPADATNELHYGGWSASTGDADWELRPLLGKVGFPPALYNTAYYSNPKVDADIQGGLETADPAKRAAFYKDAQEQVWKDAPWIFLASTNIVYARAKGLTGIDVMPDGQTLTAGAAFAQ
jgi:glutathione transport system substrate-binding protein